MNFRLKYRIFMFIALSVAVTSCSGADPDEPISGAAMEFSAGSEARSSRADNAGLSEFVVFGDIKHKDTGRLTTFMNGLTVSYNGTEGRWEYSGTQYWFPKYEHSFVAISPKSVVTADAVNVTYQNSQLALTYTLPEDHTNTADILVATHRRQYEEGETDKVILTFGHVLTQINLSAALDDNKLGQDGYMEIRKIEFSGLKNKATINVTPAPIDKNGRTDDMQLALTGHDGERTLAIEFKTPIRVNNNNEYVSLFGSTDAPAPVMLPQKFETDGAQILVSYTTSDDSSEKQLSHSLKGSEWGSGKRYNYQFTISRSGLSIGECNIQPWNPVPGKIEVDYVE